MNDPELLKLFDKMDHDLRRAMQPLMLRIAVEHVDHRRPMVAIYFALVKAAKAARTACETDIPGATLDIVEKAADEDALHEMGEVALEIRDEGLEGGGTLQ